MASSPSLIEKLKAPFKEAKMFTMLILGYASGFPLMLTASSLFLWYKDNGIETKDIGFLTLIAIPYTFKYLWAPFLDKIKIPILGRRKGWILITQVLLVILIAVMSRFSPANSPIIIAFIGFLICFVSATQDIAINAYQTEVLLEHERALGNAIAVMGYRIGMLVTGSLVLIIVDRLNNNWNLAWLMIIPFFIICPLYTLLIKESQYQDAPKNFKDAFVLPFVEFFKRQGLYTAIIIIIILISYKLADAIAFSLNSIFFIDLGFSKTTIAVSYKTLSLFASLAGLVAGGLIAKQIGVYKSFLYFSIIMACANLTYVLLAIVGKNYYLMLISVSVEYFCGAMGTAMLVAMIMSLVNVKFSATQFAILSSIDSLARVFVGPLAGYIQAHYRWEGLFIFSFIVGMFISLLIFIFRTRIKLMANLQ
ncbi:AmpG family muropeptide MFS transporter [Francisella hispaniensis]|uniref:AmpG permease n=2 Tax=Francisella hispaniensis TaxID=622488 RepID=F4BHQ9_9GAMM|nr:MFS transporter [Francisella hispaniensis]AEE27003.1 AmpG permease [Francisella hispaniensis]APD51104.1 MFS transporter [Francisella hispaniensis FSC454]KYW86730.1 MFS transporter [Francisella hispaniensis FSC454]